jgi:hypothetical protein
MLLSFTIFILKKKKLVERNVSSFKNICHFFQQIYILPPQIQCSPRTTNCGRTAAAEHWLSFESNANQPSTWGWEMFSLYFLRPHTNCGRTLWPSVLSYFAHIHQVVTALKPILKPDLLKIRSDVFFALINLWF